MTCDLWPQEMPQEEYRKGQDHRPQVCATAGSFPMHAMVQSAMVQSNHQAWEEEKTFLTWTPMI